jgi:hypothetical protein
VGKISKKLSDRFRKFRKAGERLHAQAVRDFARVPKDVKNVKQLVESGHDPLHAAYASAQNLVSFFAESVSTFPEFKPYCRIVGPAEDDYIPNAPPHSPLTRSYFTTWAFFDVPFGPDHETIGTCLLDIADLVDLDSFTVETIRMFQNTRMGIYEHCGLEKSRLRLRELVTNEEFTCHVASGYKGKEGELWYVRLCPPLCGLVDYHVALTTPYILTDANKADWTAFLKKSVLGATDEKKALHRFLKYGKKLNDWNEYIFLAYHHHQFKAIFLAGLPDVKGSLPHAELSHAGLP